MTVTYEEYNKIKFDFFRKHKYNFKENTSPMDAYGSYHKEYVFDDNSIWYEVMTPVYEKAIAEVKLCKINVEVKLFRTEFWSSDDAISRFYYEQF